MSNPVRRAELQGTIVQHGRPVGAIELPDPHETFVAEFNRRYAGRGMEIKIFEPPRDSAGGRIDRSDRTVGSGSCLTATDC